MNAARVLVRGGGDLASGVIARLHRAGFAVLVAELPQPLAVRRLVSFSEAVYDQVAQVEEISAQLAANLTEAADIQAAGRVAVLVDPELGARRDYDPVVLVDARMTKCPPELGKDAAPLVIGLGPGFEAGQNCHAAIETMRGHYLGRVIWRGAPEPDTGIPEAVANHQSDRVLRAPADGAVIAHAHICDHLQAGDPVFEVGGQVVRAPFTGVLRGLVRPGLLVKAGGKVGDLDPRDDTSYCTTISDKALAIGGGVLEAILSRSDIRQRLFEGS